MALYPISKCNAFRLFLLFSYRRPERVSIFKMVVIYLYESKYCNYFMCNIFIKFGRLSVNTFHSINSKMILDILPERKPDSHKGDYGKILLICGSRGYTGSDSFDGFPEHILYVHSYGQGRYLSESYCRP